jgi:hypothetical protein
MLIEGLGSSVRIVSNGTYSGQLTVGTLAPDCYEIRVTSSPPGGGLGTFTFARFTVTAGEGGGRPGSGSPDLSPTGITYDGSTLVVGTSTHFDAGINNLSTTADALGFNIKWLVDGQDVGAYGSHDGISRDTSVMDGNSQFDWSFSTAGTYTVTFVVDVDDHVAESNEGNNSTDVTVQVSDPAGLNFEFPLRGGSPAPPFATYGVANAELAAEDTCFGGEGHLFNQLTHAGEDWFRPAGTNVYPVAAGEVVRVVPAWDHGAAVVVEHLMPAVQHWGTDRVYSVYLHVNNPKPVGTPVNTDTVLAKVNAWPNNNHLHWEMRIYASMTSSPLPASCSSHIGPSYTDTGTNPDDFGYLNPSAWVNSH